jgi:lysocardiolipin and lysophospholipid acyltransferase
MAPTTRNPVGFVEKHRFKAVVALLVLAALLGNAAVAYLIVPLSLVTATAKWFGFLPKHIVRGCDFISSSVASGFFTYTAFLLRYVAGLQVEVTAVCPGAYAANLIDTLTLSDLIKPPPKGKTSVIVCNHRTRLDWLLMWAVLVQAPGALHALKIVLKDELSKAPLFGWAMQFFRFIFMTRKWDRDAATIKSAIKYYKAFDERTLLLIFPEGTDLHPAAVKRSDEFAEKNKLPVFKHVLHPRSTGLRAIMDELGDSLHEVIDLTMGYEDFAQGERPSEKSYFQGRVSEKLNVLVEVFRFEDIPTAKPKPGHHPVHYLGKGASVDDWLQKQFRLKEAALEAYYTLPRKNGSLKFSWMNVGYHLKLAPEMNTVPTQDRGYVRMPPPRPDLRANFLIPLMWLVGSLLTLNAALNSPIFTLVMAVGFVLETSFKKGIDHWLLFPLADFVRRPAQSNKKKGH